MKRVVILLAVLLSICVTTGCSDSSGKAEAKETRTIRISLCVWPGFAHAFIAERKGFFEKNEVDVELVLVKEQIDSAQSYKNGEVDGIFTLVPDVIIANSENIPTKIVYISDYSDTGDVIIGRAEYDSLADLKNKTVSFEGLNTFSHMFVLKAAEKDGLKEGDVKFADVKAQQVLDALEAGRIDAGHTWEPTKSRALKKGYKILAKAGDVPGIITDVLAFNSEIIKERPEQIQAIVKSLLEAHDFVRSNRVEAIEIMAAAEAMTAEEMAEGLDAVHQPDLQENLAAMQETDDLTSLHRSGEYIGRFFLNRGQLSQEPNVSEMIEPRFINKLAGK